MPLITLPGPVEIDECVVGAKVRGAHGRPPAQERSFLELNVEPQAMYYYFLWLISKEKRYYQFWYNTLKKVQRLFLINFPHMSLQMEDHFLKRMDLSIIL